MWWVAQSSWPQSGTCQPSWPMPDPHTEINQKEEQDGSGSCGEIQNSFYIFAEAKFTMKMHSVFGAMKYFEVCPQRRHRHRGNSLKYFRQLTVRPNQGSLIKLILQ